MGGKHKLRKKGPKFPFSTIGIKSEEGKKVTKETNSGGKLYLFSRCPERGRGNKGGGEQI